MRYKKKIQKKKNVGETEVETERHRNGGRQGEG